MREEDRMESQTAVLDGPLERGIALGRSRGVSPDDDLRVTKILNVEDARLELGVAPISGNPPPAPPIPNLLCFVGTVIEALAPAFS
jgi:hypothetical protein